MMRNGLLCIVLAGVFAVELGVYAVPRSLAQRRFDTFGWVPAVPSSFPTEGLVSYWSMDSVSGTTVYDTYGTNHATAVSTPLFGSAYGKYANGVLIGTGQYLDCGIGSGLNNTNAITVQAWIRQNDTQPVFGAVATKGTAATPSVTSWLLSFPNSTTLNFYINADGAWKYATISFPYNTNWHHVVGTYDKQNVRIYVDGVQGTPMSSTVGMNPTTSRKVEIGRDSHYGNFKGSIDEVSIHNTAATSNTVSELYNAGSGRFYTP